MIWYLPNENEGAGVKALDAELDRASDRATAIIAGSLVEARLTAFLKARVKDERTIWDKLTHSSAPLGSFSVKIDVAFLFGLISKEAHADLVIMKNVRNLFAHDLTIVDFNTESVRDRCMNLKLVETYVKDIDPLSFKAMPETPDLIVDRDYSFQLGGKDAMAELRDPKKRYLWSTKIFNLALGLLHDPRWREALRGKRP